MAGRPLDLSKQGFTRIPFELITNRETWVVLSNNQIRRIPNTITKLRRLERLSLSDNYIEGVSENFGELSQLTWLDLTRNSLSNLPKNLVFSKLVGLGLSENEFEELPECVFSFLSLRKFGFFSNKIRFLSPKVENLRNLVKLDLSNNLIESLPDEICSLKNLSWLNLSNNRLKTLPKNFGNLVNLEELGLGNNLLENLPDLNKIKGLRILSLFSNKLRSFNVSSHTICKIDLSSNLLVEFPACVLKIVGLNTINLKNNKIEKISLEKIEESYLQNVDLSGNFLRCVPFKFLRSLERCYGLYLENNHFENVKDHFPKIPMLRELCFAYYDPLRGPRPRFYCDSCDNVFANEPIRVYTRTKLDGEYFITIENECCSKKCYRRISRFKMDEFMSGRI